MTDRIAGRCLAQVRRALPRGERRYQLIHSAKKGGHRGRNVFERVS